MRRETFTSSAVGFIVLVGIVQFAQPAAGQEKKPLPLMPTEHREEYEQCAKACNECQRLCDLCATHCAYLIAGGNQAHLKTLQTCHDCADLCAVAARMMARGGPFADLACQACAEACARCGQACDEFPRDKMMTACAEECRRCEKECRNMLRHLPQK